MYEAAKRAQAQLDELKVQIKEDELKRSYENFKLSKQSTILINYVKMT